MEFRLVPTVQAQGLDAVAQPTFGPIDLQQTGDSEAVQVRLTTDRTTVAEGSTFTIDVELQTGTNISLDEYQLVFNYDAQRLSVIDQNDSADGTQSVLTDTLFEVVTPVADNNYASTTDGEIYLRAAGNFPVTINRKIAEIEFQAQELGVTELVTDTAPLEGTRMRRGSTDIAYDPSSLTINVNETGEAIACSADADCPDGEVCLDSGECGTPSGTECNTDDDCADGEVCENGLCVEDLSCESNSDCDTNQRCVNGLCVPIGCTSDAQCDPGLVCVDGDCVSPIPATAVFDTPGSIAMLLVSILFVGFGLYLRKSRDEVS